MVLMSATSIRFSSSNIIAPFSVTTSVTSTMKIPLSTPNPCLANMDSWARWPTYSRLDEMLFFTLTIDFQGKQNGFFLECGALDGEYLSNSLLFELQLGWSVSQSCCWLVGWLVSQSCCWSVGQLNLLTWAARENQERTSHRSQPRSLCTAEAKTEKVRQERIID